VAHEADRLAVQKAPPEALGHLRSLNQHTLDLASRPRSRFQRVDWSGVQTDQPAATSMNPSQLDELTFQGFGPKRPETSPAGRDCDRLGRVGGCGVAMFDDPREVNAGSGAKAR